MRDTVTMTTPTRENRVRADGTMAETVVAALNVLARDSFPNQTRELAEFISDYFGNPAEDSDIGMHNEFIKKTQ